MLPALTTVQNRLITPRFSSLSSKYPVNPSALHQDRFEPRFKGQVTALGKSYEVPDHILNLRSSVRYVTNLKTKSNAVHIGNNLFLCATHIIKHPNPNVKWFAALKSYDPTISHWKGHYCKVLSPDESLGISFIKQASTDLLETKSFLPLAERSPAVNEPVYLIANHDDLNQSDLDEAIALPAQVIVKTPNSDLFNINCEALTLKSFVPLGLAGSAIVNQQGELAGMLIGAKFIDGTQHSTGQFTIIGVEAIREKLQELSAQGTEN